MGYICILWEILFCFHFMAFFMLLSSGIEARLVDVSIGFNYHCYRGIEPGKRLDYRATLLRIQKPDVANMGSWVKWGMAFSIRTVYCIFHGWAGTQLNPSPHRLIYKHGLQKPNRHPLFNINVYDIRKLRLNSFILWKCGKQIRPYTFLWANKSQCQASVVSGAEHWWCFPAASHPVCLRKRTFMW